MKVQQPNWLYCLGNELHEVDSMTTLGKTHRSLSVFDRSATNTLMSVDGSQRYATEDFLFCIFNLSPERYCYMHIFRNVTDSDLTYMRLRYGFNRMYLVDESSKSILIGNAGNSIYLEVHNNRHLDEDDVTELQRKTIVQLKNCEVT